MKNSLWKVAAVFVTFHFLWNSTKNEARANDSAFSGVSGTPKPMKGEHRSIAMQSEKIVIVADTKGTSTTVDFVFRNDGGKTSVQMGFPESSYNDGELKGKSAFLRFATSIDGKKVAARRIVVSSESPETEAFWLKTVDFAPRQTRRVRVEYRSPWGGTTEWGTHRALVYNFTGQNWKGKVERSDLEIRVVSPGLWIGLPLFDGAPIPMALTSSSDAGIFRKTWRNWQAQGTFIFGLTRAVPFWMLDKNTISNSMNVPARLKNAATFRVGKVPENLPRDAETPDAFTRNGATYISLSHLKRRLEDWTNDLDLKWNEKTRVSTLRVGQKSLHFSPNTPLAETPLRPILLRGEYDSTLYVPLAPVAKTLGLNFKLDPKNRLFELNSGTLLQK
ncbi:hypothetical protein B1R32_12823 [Abditibacterium utsteinense]|uniref:Copper amine oxidase N-terminal domain-containing protein n=1 Tax=Abditibacterium utsteinense TaxID=1960156 RepID=A0A2S8SP56_9BACT|nr:hypothetical protein [Abditibacterium utsteinense]PQV62585.1 hypothetical protein B1R32_12823 [Abditibacterium utsteinense]